jgi:hypothetical protein
MLQASPPDVLAHDARLSYFVAAFVGVSRCMWQPLLAVAVAKGTFAAHCWHISPPAAWLTFEPSRDALALLHLHEASTRTSAYL